MKTHWFTVSLAIKCDSGSQLDREEAFAAVRDEVIAVVGHAEDGSTWTVYAFGIDEGK